MSDQQPKKRRKGEHRALFLTRIDVIRTELQQGWPVKSVYERHKSELQMSYPQFWRYVSSLILKGTPKGSGTAPPHEAVPPPVGTPEQPPAKPTDPDGGPVIRQFEYNPRAKNPEDLI
ncbi:TraK family protein [Azospirillum sp. B506]|uniref:TraK family protein n=1 Tax=Azospirillum sp. B506 TaxID=137721 RepID=UPI000349776F|nr:TraK family protein [Azospirillum sp. B506]